MKFKLFSVALVSILSSVAFADSHNAPKTKAACTSHAKQGWTWADGKCVKAEKMHSNTPADAAADHGSAPKEAPAPAPEAEDEGETK